MTGVRSEVFKTQTDDFAPMQSVVTNYSDPDGPTLHPFTARLVPLATAGWIPRPGRRMLNT